MKKSGLSQETLKIIACVTMLIDHVGATVVESQFFVTPFDGIYYLYFAMRIIWPGGVSDLLLSAG